MIRVKKSLPPPERLPTAGCNDDSVVRQMHADQNGKCYLCETRTTTDFEVEHCHSIAHQGGKDDWNNIFLACSYCNDKKGARFDDILNPATYNVEEIIEHRYNSSTKTFVFTASGSASAGTDATIRLLSLIFNGANPRMLKIREEEFQRKFLYEYNGFLERLGRYLESPNSETAQPVLDDLEQTSEYLAFKYQVIVSDQKLAAKFGNAVRWNKVSALQR